MDVLKQRDWETAELVAHGFVYYLPHKRLVMARELPEAEGQKVIRTPWDTLVAEPGYVICYDPGTTPRLSLDAYHQWPVEPHIFVQNYAPWDEEWKPGPAEAHLQSLGCKPYYRSRGVWARKLTHSQWVQSIESPEPVEIPADAWLCIGIHGDPYSMMDDDFRSRYYVPGDVRKVLKRLVTFFRR